MSTRLFFQTRMQLLYFGVASIHLVRPSKHKQNVNEISITVEMPSSAAILAQCVCLGVSVRTSFADRLREMCTACHTITCYLHWSKERCRNTPLPSSSGPDEGTRYSNWICARQWFAAFRTRLFLSLLHASHPCTH